MTSKELWELRSAFGRFEMRDEGLTDWILQMI